MLVNNYQTTERPRIDTDHRASLKARGLFHMMVTKWLWSHGVYEYQPTEENLSFEVRDGRGAVRTGIQELIKLGYLKRVKENNEKGHSKSIYELYW